MGRLLIVLGALIALVGIVLVLFPRAFAWFGNLPGDINVRRGNTHVFIPITSMIVVSLALSAIANLIAWLSRYLR